MLAPAMGCTARTSTGNGVGEGVQAGESALRHGSGAKRAYCSLLLALLAAPPTCPVATATSTFEPYTLKVKTCNATRAGTAGQLFLSFCDGYNSCMMGPANEYNFDEELNIIGAWSTLEVPLEYEPTTMSMTLVGDDAWCVEEVVWNDRGNMLGTGGRLYLDGDLGEVGCNYGVHTDTGWYYPCKDNWRFFNLPESDDYRYEIKVKPCGSSTATTAGSKRTSSPEIAASLCSESQCNQTVGEVIDFDLNVIAAVGGSHSGWATSLIPAGFNPVAMKLTNTGDFPWCAAAITFNDYTLIDENDTPQGLKLGVGDVRRFFNVQFLGAAALPSGEPYGGSEDDELEHKAWELAWEVGTSVLIFTATVAITLFARRFRRGRGKDGDGSVDDGVGGEANEDGDGLVDDGVEADESPLCKTCHYAEPPSGIRGLGSMAATSAAGEKASKKKGYDRACSRRGDTELDVFCFQHRRRDLTTSSRDGDGLGKTGKSTSSSTGQTISGGMRSSKTSSTETVVVAYHHPWELEPA